MKKTLLLLFCFAITMVLPSTSVLAEPVFMKDVNTACGAITVECSACHNLNNFDQYTPGQGIYESNGACGFCPSNDSCSLVRPSRAELLADARDTTNQYFQTLFKLFMKHLQEEQGDFAAVFPDCPEIAPIIASDISRDKGYLVRRVTDRARNTRNIPDKWEAEQLKKFDEKAKDGKKRTQFNITKPDGSILPTKEFESYKVVDEGDTKYFRYMRSITMPGPPSEPPNLPCLKCHGTFDQLADGVLEQIEAEYPYDLALGYKKGDIRGAWTIKIPIIEGKD